MTLERKFFDLTPVRHKTEGYYGWIDGITYMKEHFTGNQDCQWQYRIYISGSEKRRVAPEADLEINKDALDKLPPRALSSLNSGYYKDETQLHALGYQISDKSWQERWQILHNVAIPKLGVENVLETILNLIYKTLQSGGKVVTKNKNALVEWQSDVDMILDNYGYSTGAINKDLLQYIYKIKRELESQGIESSIKAEQVLQSIK